MDCNNCNSVSTITMPASAYELEKAKDERTIKRLINTVVAVLILWFATIAVFVWYLNQYDYSSESVEYSQNGEGVNVIGDQNGVTYNEPETGN